MHLDAERISDDTPILVGVGQTSDRRGAPGYHAWSPADLAAEAGRLACDDALSLEKIAPLIDVVVSVRITADARPPAMRAAALPFGWTDNVPGVVARKMGASKARGIYSPACGDEPQKLVGEFCERLNAGEFRFVLICGGEATSTVRGAVADGETHDWAETSDAPLEDRGPQTEGMRSSQMGDHKLAAPLSIYPLFEQARRKRTGQSRQAYRAAIGELFAPFTEVAGANAHAAAPRALTPDQIATVTQSNRMTGDPHTRLMVAREQVNLGAAVLLTTVGAARELGVPQEKWVYLHGYAHAAEPMVMARQDLGKAPAMALTYQRALACAGVEVDQIRYMDIYSCFPIAVFTAIEALGISPTDPRGLTLTGGLPYFGGPGNNYSMHGIVELAARLRADRGALGMVGANGGLLSTHAVGIYSTAPRPWHTCDSGDLQAQVDAMTPPAFTDTPQGWGQVETYTVLYDKAGPTHVVVVGRLEATNQRFLALAGDPDATRRFIDQDGLDARIFVTPGERTNRFVLCEAQQ